MNARTLTESQLQIARQNEMLDRYKKSQILIVEDSAEARGMIRGFIRDTGADKIDLAVSGQEAIDQLKSRRYDIVLCDYNLGKGKNGQQVLEEARYSHYLRQQAIFIMITAETSVEMVMSALEYQPDSYLSKPFTRNELMRRLDRAVLAKIEYRDIELAFEAKKFVKAITLCDAKLKSAAPERPMRALRLRSAALIELEDYESAKRLYELVLADRDVPWARIGLGRSCYHLGMYETAKDIFETLLREQPDIIESYDWLARVQIAMEQKRKAQDTLQLATARSPRAILRQMELARVAMDNNSFLVAEKAYRKAIMLATDSCYHTPDNYLQYVRSLLVKLDTVQSKLSKDSFTEACLFLNRLRKEFDGDEFIDFQAAMLEAEANQAVGNESAAGAQADRASRMYRNLTVPQQLDLAEVFVSGLATIGRIEDGRKVTHELQKTHDDPALAAKLNQVLKDAVMRLESETLNREALALYQSGRIVDAHQKFQKAAETKGASVNILLNAVNVCLDLSEKQNLNQQEWRRECEVYLDRLANLDSQDHRFGLLQDYRERLLKCET